MAARAATTAPITNDSVTAGPACCLASTPARVKIPVPMMMPTPKPIMSFAPSRLRSPSLLLPRSRTAETLIVRRKALVMRWTLEDRRHPRIPVGHDCSESPNSPVWSWLRRRHVGAQRQVLGGQDRGLHARLQPELGQHPRHVRLHRGLADGQL